MYVTKKTAKSREAFTLVEMIVVIAIILAIAALAAAFAPRVTDSTNLTRAVDNLEQYLLTARMRAKRDGLATGVRFVQASGDGAGIYSQLQYIQQAAPLSGGSAASKASADAYVDPTGNSTSYYTGGLCLPKTSNTTWQVQLYNVDCSMGGTLPENQYLIQNGDFLQIRDGGVFQIAAASATMGTYPITTLTLLGTDYDKSLIVSSPTTNYTIFRQPRILLGEAPLLLPDNFAVNSNTLPGTSSLGWNVVPRVVTISSGAQYTYPEILFSPSGAVVGNNVGLGTILLSVYDQTMTSFDINRVGIIAIRCRTGFIAAYSAAEGSDPFFLAENGQESGL